MNGYGMIAGAILIHAGIVGGSKTRPSTEALTIAFGIVIMVISAMIS